MLGYFFTSMPRITRLNKTQSQALRICCRAIRSTPPCTLQASCNHWLLELRHQILCFSFKAKLIRSTQDSHPAQNLIEDSVDELYFLTEHTIRTFNEPTKSPVSTSYEVSSRASGTAFLQERHSGYYIIPSQISNSRIVSLK